MILQALTAMIAGWMSRHQQQIIGYLLVVTELSTRRVQIAGSTPHPNEAFMMSER